MLLFLTVFIIGLCVFPKRTQPIQKPDWWIRLWAPQTDHRVYHDDPELKLGSDTLTYAENELYEPNR